MNIVFSIDAPFLTPAEFAKRTGQTKCAVEQQLKNGQLPRFYLSRSVKAKDKGSTRPYHALLVDNMKLQMDAIKDNGLKFVKAS